MQDEERKSYIRFRFSSVKTSTSRGLVRTKGHFRKNERSMTWRGATLVAGEKRDISTGEAASPPG